ncbi:MAG: hypothetical protein LBF69_01885 [Prevotellaceae bacterium]|nr:hypothetical protein [Prevotellaceae bacterium]
MTSLSEAIFTPEAASHPPQLAAQIDRRSLPVREVERQRQETMDDVKI